MPVYRASIEYNPDTMRILNAAIFSTFRTRQRTAYLFFCFGLMCAGAAVGLNSTGGLALICLGGFLLPSVRAVEKNQAEQMIKRMNGRVLKVDYTFEDDRFVCAGAGERNEFTYGSIARLVEAKEYFYLFPNNRQGYMIARSTIKPGSEEDFKAFISKRVGLEWTRTSGVLTLNLKQIISNRRNTRLKK